MIIRRSTIRWAYRLVAVAALLLTGVHVLPYLDAGFVDGTAAFWTDALVNTNAAGRFLAIDVLFLALAVIAWMVFESRRLAMRGVWIYVLVGLVIGISFAVPLWLAARETALIRAGSDRAEPLGRGDLAGLFLLAAVVLASGIATALK